MVIAIATEGDKTIGEHCEKVLYVPATHELFQPLLTVLPMQLLSYEMAVARGNDVDNLGTWPRA